MVISENIDIDIHIDMVILENINIYIRENINIDMNFLENININIDKGVLQI